MLLLDLRRERLPVEIREASLALPSKLLLDVLDRLSVWIIEIDPSIDAVLHCPVDHRIDVAGDSAIRRRRQLTEVGRVLSLVRRSMFPTGVGHQLPLDPAEAPKNFVIARQEPVSRKLLVLFPCPMQTGRDTGRP